MFEGVTMYTYIFYRKGLGDHHQHLNLMNWMMMLRLMWMLKLML
jgi:hypothetical protein